MADKKNKNLVAESLLNSINSLKNASEELDETPSNDVQKETEGEVLATVENTLQKEELKLEAKVMKITDKHNNIVVTYNNPMENLIKDYNSMLERIRQEEKDILGGFKKRQPQSETHANATIQVRRDIYSLINEYIADQRLGKTKVLNEIFQLGVNEFIKKYSR